MSTDSNTIVSKILQLSQQDASRLKELEKFRRSVAVLFTDIQGSTAYYEKFGDVAGLAMVYECNSLLEGVVIAHEGRVIKNIGDAIMAYFDNCEQCVLATIDMQRKLKDVNSRKPANDRTLVRVGAHYGIGIVKSQDIFGDVVNVASRVQSLAHPEQILISESVFEKVREVKSFEIVSLGRFQLKGKKEEHEIYEVKWDESRDARPRLAQPQPLPPATGVEFKLQHLDAAGKVDAEYVLSEQGFTIGREQGDLRYKQDSSMGSPHARIFLEHGHPMVEDLKPEIGVFVRLNTVFTLEDKDVILMGAQLFKFESRPELIFAATTMALPVADVSQAMHEDAARLFRLNHIGSGPPEHFAIYKEEVRFGRTIGDYTFPQDRFMSRAHARVYLRGENYFLQDLSSSNGTFVKIRSRSRISAGSLLRVGRELFGVICPTARLGDEIPAEPTVGRSISCPPQK